MYEMLFYTKIINNSVVCLMALNFNFASAAAAAAIH